MKFGLLGKTLGHSYSPRIHHELGNKEYSLFERQPEDLDAFFEDSELQGINITIPYKIKALEACQNISSVAKTIGCVNTMVRQQDGSWYGHNTDYDGFIYMLKQANIPIQGQHCLVLGDGATSTTIHVALKNMGAKSITHLSRKQAPTYNDVGQFYKETDIIINATPVGMYPNCPEQLIDLTPFKNLKGVADVIYNPHRTALLVQAEQLGIPATDGLPMLVAQAVYAANLFQNVEHDESRINTIVDEIRSELDNIVIIGMPGSGKTTIGGELAKELGRTFYDADVVFTETYGKTPAQVIEAEGEPVFRQMESAILAKLSKETGLVIATGGGCVTQANNYPILRQNGRIYCLQRDLDQLDTAGRPLSQGGLEHLIELEKIRRPMYQVFAQKMIDNKTIQDTVATIKEDFYAHTHHEWS